MTGGCINEELHNFNASLGR